MNICFVCGSLDQHGGSENYAEALATLAQRAGFGVAIYTPLKVVSDATIRAHLPSEAFRSAQEIWQDEPYGRAVYLAAKARHYLRRRTAPTAGEEAQFGRARARGVLRAFWDKHAASIFRSCDIVHLIGKPKSFLVAAAEHARRLKRPVIYSEVAQVTEKYAGAAEHREFVDRCNSIDLLLCYYAQQIADIRRLFGYRGQAKVVEQWAYDDEARLLRLSFRPVERMVTFGSLCRLTEEKGLDTLLRGFAKAAGRCPQIRLRIAGTGSLEPALRRLARDLHIVDRTEFLGYVRDRVAVYESIDAFVIASSQEGGPITAVEAMAAGRPIITTPVGAMPERLHDGEDGLFFAAGDVEMLAAHMIQVASDPALRRRLAHASRERYGSRNQAAVNARTSVDIWETLGAARAGARLQGAVLA